MQKNAAPHPLLILASASPRRLSLLQQLRIVPDKVEPAEIDETPRRNELPASYAKRIAAEKAAKISALHPRDIVLAADTVVACGRRILPKAETPEQAETCLKLLSGRRHRVLTSVSVLPPDGRRGKHVLVTSVVRFKRLSRTEIDAYLSSGEWEGKAGGYAIQGLAAAFIPFIGGSYSSIVGLPLMETSYLLKEAGYEQRV